MPHSHNICWHCHSTTVTVSSPVITLTSPSSLLQFHCLHHCLNTTPCWHKHFHNCSPDVTVSIINMPLMLSQHDTSCISIFHIPLLLYKFYLYNHFFLYQYIALHHSNATTAASIYGTTPLPFFCVRTPSTFSQHHRRLYFHFTSASVYTPAIPLPSMLMPMCIYPHLRRYLFHVITLTFISPLFWRHHSVSSKTLTTLHFCRYIICLLKPLKISSSRVS